MQLSQEKLVEQIIDEILRWQELGLTPAAIFGNPTSGALIKRRFIALSQFIHPDKVPLELNEAANEAQKIINDANQFLLDKDKVAEEQANTRFKSYYATNPQPAFPKFSAVPYLIPLLFNRAFKSSSEEELRVLIEENAAAFSSALPSETWSAAKRAIDNKNYEILSFFLKTTPGQALLQKARAHTLFCRSLLRGVDNKALEILMEHGLTTTTIADSIEHIDQPELDTILNLLELSEQHFKQIYFAQAAVKKETLEIVRAIMSGPLSPKEKMNYLLATKNLIRANDAHNKQACKTTFNNIIDTIEVSIVQGAESRRNFFLNLCVNFFRWLGLIGQSTLTKKSKLLLQKYETTTIEPGIILNVELEKVLPVEDRTSRIATALASQNYHDFWEGLADDRAVALLSSSTQMAHWLDKTPATDYPRLFEALGERKINYLKSHTAVLTTVLLALPTRAYSSILAVMNVSDNPALVASIFSQLSPEKRRLFFQDIAPGLPLASHIAIFRSVEPDKRHEYLKILKAFQPTLPQDLIKSALLPEILSLLDNNYVNYLDILSKEKVHSSLKAISTLFNGLDVKEYPAVLRALGRSELIAKPNFLSYIIRNLPAEKQPAFINNIITIMDLDSIMALLRLLEAGNRPLYITLVSSKQTNLLQDLLGRNLLIEVLSLLGNNYRVFLDAMGKDKVFANNDALFLLFNAVDVAEYPALISALGKSELIAESKLPNFTYHVINRLPVEKRCLLIQTLVADLSTTSCVSLLGSFDADKRLEYLKEVNKTKPTFLNEILTTNSLNGVMRLLNGADQRSFILSYIAIIENEQMLADVINAVTLPEITYLLENFRGIGSIIGGGDRLFTFLERLTPEKRARISEIIAPQLNVLIPVGDRFKPLFNLISPVRHLRLFTYLQTLSTEEKTALLELVPILAPLYNGSRLSMEEIAAHKPEQLAIMARRAHGERLTDKMRELLVAANSVQVAISSIYLTVANAECGHSLLDGMQVKRTLSFFSGPIVPKYRDAFLSITARINELLTTITTCKSDISTTRTFCALPEPGSAREEDVILRETLAPMTAGLSAYLSLNRANLSKLPMIASSGVEKNCLIEMDNIISRLSLHIPAATAGIAVAATP